MFVRSDTKIKEGSAEGKSHGMKLTRFISTLILAEKL